MRHLPIWFIRHWCCQRMYGGYVTVHWIDESLERGPGLFVVACAVSVPPGQYVVLDEKAADVLACA